MKGIGSNRLWRNRLRLSKRPKRISLPTGRPAKKSGQRRHILLVEDHEPTRLALAQLLLHRRYKVASADSIAQARSLMKKNKDLALLISDIGLPDGSGYDLMNEFQKKLARKASP
jgi:CheY-like chemotaxis protein